jgi:hypothetical protein
LVTSAVVSVLLLCLAVVLLLGLIPRLSDSVQLVAGLAVVLVLFGIVLMSGVGWAVVHLTRRMDQIESALRKSRDELQKSRKDASRHEYIQEQALGRIERVARQLGATTSGALWLERRAPVDPASPLRSSSVLFVTSNGGGMGHIARCAAVMRHGSGRILTLSTAADLVASSGLDVRYFPSQAQSDRGAERWHRQFMRRLLEEVSELEPAKIVFDGTWVYPALTDVAELADIPLVWLRRGLWRQGVDLSQVESWSEHVTSVVTPRDVAEDEVSAPVPFRDAAWCDPISLATDERFERGEALERLGLDPGREYALVQVSGGNSAGEAMGRAVDAVRDSARDVTPVIVRSPLMTAAVPAGAKVIDARFPLVDFSAAWSFTITGAGYNSVHENLHTSTPGIYLPSATTLTDDQVARARAMHDGGWGVLADGAAGLPDAVRQLVGAERGSGITQAIRRRATPNGARQASEHIEAIDRDTQGNSWV